MTLGYCIKVLSLHGKGAERKRAFSFGARQAVSGRGQMPYCYIILYASNVLLQFTTVVICYSIV